MRSLHWEKISPSLALAALSFPGIGPYEPVLALALPGFCLPSLYLPLIFPNTLKPPDLDYNHYPEEKYNTIHSI
jgi:hypothetical protein